MQRVPAAMVVFLLAGTSVGVCRGAEPDGMPVYTDPAHADADFAFQGEYRGWQRQADSLRTSEPIGLQVVARGDGKFVAMKYPGGLPGNGWSGGNRYQLAGEIGDSGLQLTGDKYDFILKDGKGTVFNKQGRRCGELTQVHRVSPTMGLAAPPDAKRLFTGGESPLLQNAKVSPEGWLLAGTQTVEPYRNFYLHGEFLLPYKPLATGQARANSGFYLQSRYEVQVLDSFGLEGVNNECGALYKSIPPKINMCLPPLEWQTYDIDFREPVFDDAGKKVANARISVWHNGVLVHNDIEIPNKTGGGSQEGPSLLPIKIQDHGNPVMFRNVWLVEKPADAPRTAPPLPTALPPVPVLARVTPE
jgi:hypothetical protein